MGHPVYIGNLDLRMRKQIFDFLIFYILDVLLLFFSGT